MSKSWESDSSTALLFFFTQGFRPQKIQSMCLHCWPVSRTPQEALGSILQVMHPILCLEVFSLLQMIKNMSLSPVGCHSPFNGWPSLWAVGIFRSIQSFRQRLWCLNMAHRGRGCWLLSILASSWSCHSAGHIVQLCCWLWQVVGLWPVKCDEHLFLSWPVTTHFTLYSVSW